MAKLSTHVLDTARGRPAAGVRVDLSRLDAAGWTLLKTVYTNADGRTDQPLLMGDALRPGRYELLFHIGAYFAAGDVDSGQPPFLDQVPVRFGVGAPDQNYHVPLVASPWSFATYRGS